MSGSTTDDAQYRGSMQVIVPFLVDLAGRFPILRRAILLAMAEQLQCPPLVPLSGDFIRLVTATSVGGTGGTVNSGSGNAGNGGLASLGTVNGSSLSSSRSVGVNGRVMGAAAEPLPRGKGGNGASETLTNAISASTGGAVSLSRTLAAETAAVVAHGKPVMPVRP